MKHTRFALVLLLFALSCSPPLPTAYGVYARQGRSLVDLTDKNASDDWDLPQGIAILVYERELGDPGFKPERDLTLYRTGFARSEYVLELAATPKAAQEILNRGPGAVPVGEVTGMAVRKQSLTRKDSWILLGAPVGVRFEPVGERRDILALVPDSPLPEGTYALTRSYGESQPVSFGVGLGGDAQHRQRATCVDEVLYTVRRPEGFQGWGQWFTDATNMEAERRRRTAADNPVVVAITQPCAALDRQVSQWLDDLQNLPPDAARGASARILVLKPSDQGVTAAIRQQFTVRAKTALSGADWGNARRWAEYGISLAGPSSELENVRNTAQAEISRGAQERQQSEAREAARLAALRNKSMEPTKTIATYADVDFFTGKKQGISLTDASLLVGRSNRLNGGGYGGTVWFGNVQGAPTKEPFHETAMGWRGWLVDVPGCCKITFRDEGECDRFVTDLVEAVGQWRQTYPELVP